MTTQAHGPAQESINKHRIGVAFALVGGAAAYYFPTHIAETFVIESPLLGFSWLAATMGLPLVLGFLYPRQPWQWGLLVLVGQLLFMLVIEGNGDMAQFPIGVALYAILLLPVVLFGLLGSGLSKVFSRYARRS
jgi:hypothetical protein